MIGTDGAMKHNALRFGIEKSLSKLVFNKRFYTSIRIPRKYVPGLNVEDIM